MRQRAWAVILLGLASLAASAADQDGSSWKAGVATVEITPRKPMWMAGYASRKKPAEGKAQDLFAKALALEDGRGTRLVMVTMDLISVPRPLRDRLEQVAREKYRLPPEGLLISCSHTHCGPELRASAPALQGVDPERARQAREYLEGLEARLTALIGQALERLAPARLSYCHARCGFAMNRRLPTDRGYRNSPYPEGPVDHDVPVLRVEGPDGKLRALLFGYACHNTTLSFYQYCGDYAGYAQEYLERLHPGATALFLMGCGGDQNPYPRGTLELAQHHGQTLALAVQAALATPARPLGGPLRLAYDLATVEYAKPLPTAEQLRKKISAARDDYERRHAEKLLATLEKTGSLPASYSCPVQVIHLGDDLVLAGLPGETVIDYALRLKRELGGKKAIVWVAGYCNDVFAYLPSRRVLEEGGYEAGESMKYMTTILHPGWFAPSVEERVIGKTLELDRRLRGQPSP